MITNLFTYNFMMPRITLILLFQLAFYSAAISQCDYAKLVEEGRALAARQRFRAALAKFSAARECDPAHSADIDLETARLFEALEQQRDEAILQTTGLRDQLRQTADSLSGEANAWRRRAEMLQRKIPFFNGRYAFAAQWLNSELYNLIDANLRRLNNYDFTEATPFSVYTGYATVRPYGAKTYALADTFGQQFPLATRVDELNPAITALDLHFQNPHAVPEAVWKQRQLKVLILVGNTLQVLPPQIGQLDSLEDLDLRATGLKSLPPEIGRLQRLRMLKLNTNNLTSLPASIGQLQQLNYLDLAMNHLDTIPEELTALPALQTLKIGLGANAQIPASIGRLRNLRSLALANGGFTILPPTIGQLQQLEELAVFQSKLKTLPSEFSQLRRLRRLSLALCQFDAVPEVLTALDSLESLTMSFNPALKPTGALGRLKRLKALYLGGGGSVEPLLPEIGQLTALRQLGIWNAKIGALSPAIGQLRQLRELNLNENELRALPPALMQLDRLEVLTLAKNQLRQIPDQIAQLTSLQTLDLSNNQLRMLPPGIGRLRNLRLLDLRGNDSLSLASLCAAFRDFARPIVFSTGSATEPDNYEALLIRLPDVAELPDEIGQVQHLEALLLSFNALRVLPATIGQLQHLRTLMLTSNKLNALPPEIGQCARLEELYLTGNPLKQLPAELCKLSALRICQFSTSEDLKDIPPCLDHFKERY